MYRQRASWQHCQPNVPLPRNAVLAGHDSDGSPLFVGRAIHEGGQLPGKIVANRHIAYVCCNGKEHEKPLFEVLCGGNVSWQQSGFGQVPPNAVLGGRTSGGEPLYIGRAHHNGSLTPGKVHPSHSALYIPYGGSELNMKNYEILVEK
ncbi:natterin-3-like [Anopheles cruzii]|uniref:natterin-3-like n=1 Tax=Anopheles cruzii TaxID=68878 RepID=UPI0022EC8325|nr:natterin-3-like [Anopheles cruzii]